MFLSRSFGLFVVAVYVVVLQVDLCVAQSQIADKYYAVSRAAVSYTPPGGPLFVIDPVPRGFFSNYILYYMCSKTIYMEL